MGVSMLISVAMHGGVLAWISIDVADGVTSIRAERPSIKVILVAASTPLSALPTKVPPLPVSKPVTGDTPSHPAKKSSISEKPPKPIEKKTAIQEKVEQLIPHREAATEATNTGERIAEISTPALSSSIVPVSTPEVSESAVRSSQAEKKYLASLRAAISRYIHYPVRARRMMKEGQVWVEFLVYSDGYIDQVSIRESSGEPMLDRAARKSVLKLGRYQPFPEELEVASLLVTLPMNYEVH